MYPIYRYMDSYPQPCHPHRDQASYPQHVFPSWESSRYFSPGDYNGCRNHAYPPMPLIPYPHPQPPQHHFHGAYPPCPNIYPAYFIPPPQCLVDQGRTHCCGCPNHSCQRTDDGILKIEEGNPGIESKDHSSPGVTRWPSYPYPPVWFPPDLTKDNDHKTSKMKDYDSSAMIQWPTYPYPQFQFPLNHMKNNNHKASEPQQHGPLDMWIPLDKNSLNSFRENGEKTIQNQQNEAKRMQLPLPILWMPNYDQSQEAERNVKDANASPKVAEDLPSKFKVIPVNLLENDNCNEKPAVEEVNPGSQICPTLPEKGSRPKNIPVKHMEEIGPEKLDHPEKQGDKLSAVEKQKGENQEKKANGTKKQMSPGRSSKLPPVCLRVDPLPRKNTGNDSPTSPSPARNKEVKDTEESKESKAGSSGDLKESMKDAAMDKDIRVVGAEDRLNGKSQKEGTKDMRRVVEIEDGLTSKKEGGEKSQSKLDADVPENHSETGTEVVAGAEKSEDMAKGEENKKHGKLEDNEEVSLGGFENKIADFKNSVESLDVKIMEENTGSRGKLSETDAVLQIQAAYRGYEVRRWEPLKKLQQLTRIRDQVSSIKQQVRSLEVSSERGQLDEKQMLYIGETIMNLLLQLDTIQGLHPSVRDIRKSVASDLVSLQEKLDMLSSKVAGGLVHIEAGAAATVRDSQNALEDSQCNSTTDLKESSFPQEEPAQPPTDDSFDDSAADKQEETIELLLGVDKQENSTLNNKQLLIDNVGDEQVPNSETGLTVKSEFENEEPLSNGTEEYTKAPTALEIRVDSMATNLSDLPTREEHSCTMVEKELEHQLGLQDETVRASVGKDHSLAEVDNCLQEDNKAEAKEEERHEMQAKQVEQPSVNALPFHAADPIMLPEEENVQLAPLVEDLKNIDHQPMRSSEGSESPQHYEASASRNEASIMKNGEVGQGELLNESSLENHCPEVDDAGFRVLTCLESIMSETDVEESGSEDVTGGKHEFKELSGYASVNPEAAAEESDAEHPKVEILDAPVPACSAGVDLADEDNYHNTPAVIVDENTSEEQEHETRTELPKIEDIGIESAGSTIGTECSTESTSPTGASDEAKVPKTVQTCVDDMDRERKLIEENEKLREMLEKLLETGNKQLAMISSLSGRLKGLEKKVARRRKLRVKPPHTASKNFPCNNLVPKAAVESAV